MLHSNTLSALSSCTSGESDSYFRFGDTCYVISGDQCTWFVARMRCHAKGGDLVRIRSRDEFDLLVSQLIALKYWIGLRALPWIWSDGNYRASSYTPNQLENNLKMYLCVYLWVCACMYHCMCICVCLYMSWCVLVCLRIRVIIGSLSVERFWSSFQCRPTSSERVSKKGMSSGRKDGWREGCWGNRERGTIIMEITLNNCLIPI